MSACLVGSGLVAGAAQAAPKRPVPMPGTQSSSRVPKPVPPRTSGAERPAQRTLGRVAPRTPRPPVPGTASAPVGAGYRRIGALPVSVANATPPSTGKAGRPSAEPVSAVLATTVDPASVDRVGGRSIGFQLRRGDGGSAAGPVSVRVDTSSVADVFGGGFPARLRLVRYPACALTTPTVPGCAKSTPVASVADPVKRTVTAVVNAEPSVPASARTATAGVVYVLAAASGGVDGSYAATPLKSSDGWVVGEQAGSFSYSYPLPAAAATGGETPSLALSYDSGSVDGLTSKENNQSSPVGLGWDLAVPFIEHRMAPCTTSNLAGNLCWAGDQFTLSMHGQASALVHTGTGGAGEVYRMQDDQGWRIEQVFAGTTANPNGDGSGVYWRVTTADGTQYFFGREHAAWSTSAGNSTLNVLMYAQNSNDVCWSASNHRCQIAWRWNLAFVVDPVGNLQTYGWEKARYSYTTAASGVQHYDGAGYLTSVKYGKLTSNATEVTSPQRIDFDYGWRCTYAGCPEPTASNAANYPEVPFDQWCKGDATSCSSGPNSPVFFYLKRLNSVTAKVYNGSGYTPVERVDLTYTYPYHADQTWSAVQWLSSITKTGYAPSGATSSLPAVSFQAEWMRNRWDRSSIGHYQEKPRVIEVVTELGGRARVSYGQPIPCDGQTLDGNEDKQTTNCYPSLEDNGHQAWFRRYVVTRLDEIDRYGAPTQTTSYEYDTEAGVGWHSDNDPVTPKDKQRWSDYRGYKKVTIREGTPDGPVTTTKKRFFRGMDGDHLKDGSTRSEQVKTATVDDTATSSLYYRDHYYLKGQLLEERIEHTDGTEVEATQHEYTATVAARGPAGPWDLYQNGVVRANPALTREMATADGVERKLKHTVRHTYDAAFGMLVSTQDDGDPVSGDGLSCTHTTYTRNTDAYIVETEATEVTAAGTCPSDGSAPSTGILERTDTYYDANFTTLTAPPTAGLPTKIVSWASAAGTGDPTTAITASKYDAYGRTVAIISPDNVVAGAASFDAAGPASTTTFTAPNGVLTAVSTTDVAGQTLNQVLDPGRGVPRAVTDANARTTTLSYDALGRLTAVRLHGDSFDSRTFGYTVSNTAPSVVVTSAYPAAGAEPVTSWQFYDSLGREYQNQTLSPTGTIVASGTRYDDRGNTAAEVTDFSGPGTPGTVYGQWYDAAFTATLPSQTVTRYDDIDREVSASLVSSGVTTQTTTTSYDGTSISTTPPSNAGASQVDIAPTTVTTDLADHVLTRTQGGRTMSYDYDLSGDLVKITSAAGAVSTFGYDWLGRRTSNTDPDTGTTRTEYYPSGAVKLSRDAGGAELFTTIDALSRPTATYSGTSGSGALLSSTVYDGTPLGGTGPLRGTVTSESSYVGSTPGNPGAAYTKAYGYDDKYRVTRTDQIIPAEVGQALAGTYTTTTSYDGLDRQVATSYPAAGGLAAETVTTGWNGAYPTTLTSPAASYVSATTFTGIGQVASRTLGVSGATGSVTRAYTWDPGTGELLTQAAASPSTANGANLQHDTYTYSPTGDVTRVTDAVAGQQQCYTYDNLDRLTAAVTSATGAAAGSGCQPDNTGPSPYQESYTYDADANLTTLTHNGVTSTYGYGADQARGLTGGPHAPTTVTKAGATATYAYDANGRLTTRNAGGVSTSYTWDGQDQLTSVTTGNSTARFTYGPDGSRWVRATAAETVVYLAGQEVHLAAGRNAATGVRYYSIAEHLVATRGSDADGTGSTLSWILADRQDSASIAVDAGTGAATRDRYLPYGGNRNAAPDAGWTMPTDRGWLGQIQDRDTGLNYLNARYYDPVLAHFISADPLNIQDDPQSANAYGYAAGNPIGFTDSSGLAARWITKAYKYVKAKVKAAYKVVKAKVKQVVKKVRKVIHKVIKNVKKVIRPVVKKVREIASGGRDLVQRVRRAIGREVSEKADALGKKISQAGKKLGRWIGGEDQQRGVKRLPGLKRGPDVAKTTPKDLYVGGAGTKVKPSWRDKKEYNVDSGGKVIPSTKEGFSTFADPAQARDNTNSKYHYKLPAGTPLPPSLGVVYDGASMPPDEQSHHSFVPMQSKTPDELLADFSKLGWVKGKIGADGKWQEVR